MAIHRIALLAATIVVILIGCDDQGTTQPQGSYPYAIDIELQGDTLRFAPGDSASALLTVIIVDQNGNVLEGVPIELELSNPELGYIEYLDGESRDTTNAQGKVVMLFTAVGIEGDETFTVSAAGLTRNRSLAILEQAPNPSERVQSITIEASPNVVWLYPTRPHDPVAITAAVYDWASLAIQGVRVEFSVFPSDAGHLQLIDSELLDTTDFQGRAYCELIDVSPMNARVVARAGSRADTVTVYAVTVVDDPWTLECTFDPDTLYLSHFDSASVCVYAALKDEFGRGAENIQLAVSAHAPGYGFIPPPLLPLTDDRGLSQASWDFLAEEGTYVLAVSYGGIADTSGVIVIYDEGD